MNWVSLQNSLKQYWSTIREKDATSTEFLIGLALIVFCQMSWVPGFFHDGYLYAAFAKNAAEKGTWLIPHLSEDTYSTFYQHSPFVFILGGLFFKVFGSGVTAARLFGSLWAVGMVVLLNKEMRKLHDRWLGFLSALILILSYPLVKKARFPNMDLPLCFFMLSSLLYYLRAFQLRKKIYWLLAGLFFGLAMLSKGPPALSLPLCFLIHLTLTKRLHWLLGPWPWLGLILGALIFSLWPLSLYLQGSLEIFHQYVQNMFVNTALDGRGQVENDYFIYIKILMTETLPWFLCAIYGAFLAYKRKSREMLLWVSFYFSFLIPFSFMKFKYGHYILPIYAAQAVLAAYALRSIYRRTYPYVFGILRPLTYVGALCLLIFPLTVESRRDKELLQTLNLVQKLPIPPDSWAVVNESYSFFGLANLLGYHTQDNAYAMNMSGLEAFLNDASLEEHVHHRQEIDLTHKKWLFLIKTSDWNEFTNEFQERWLKKNWLLAKWEKSQIQVFISKDFLPSKPEWPHFNIK